MVWKLVREVLKVGEATVPYPFVPVELMPGFRGKPQHDPELCIACAACAVACPPNALTMETDLDQGLTTWSIFYGRCIYCGRCEEVCPTGAIQLSQEFELAVMNKADLYERADYLLAACSQCGTFFAPAKELDYVIALVEQAGLSGEALDERKALLDLCPTCRRKTDIRKLAALSQEAV
ncbi:MAG TPA: formate hydrogenlyase complex iron-sulfur subunit [Anaerolineales bacterium]|nr:formate hydrogenlyase complex iron-sulfur subunit [Anaerolineales bacterium]